MEKGSRVSERLGWLRLHDRWGVWCFSLCGTTTVSDSASRDDWGEKWCMDIMWSTWTVENKEDMKYNNQVMWSNPFVSNNLWHAMLSTKPEIISPPSAARYTGVAR